MKAWRMDRALTGLALFTAAATAALGWSMGCGSVNPFSITLLLSGVTTGGGGGGGGGGGTGTSGLPSVCDLADALRTISVELRNESQAQVDFALVLATTAGTGGFVCTAQRQAYLSGGYRVEPLDVTNSKTFGCETVTRDRGTELLIARFDGTIQPRGADAFTSAGAPFDGSTELPLPSVMVLGDDKVASRFTCQNIDSCNPTTDTCNQGGFIYIAGTLCRVRASRTQGTLCNTRVSPRPRWVLRDPRLLDTTARDFEYVKGGSLIITILDRAASADQNVNQVVWEVRDAAGAVIHEELR